MDQKQIEEIVRSVMASMGQTAPAPSEAKCATTNCAAPVTSESCALDLGSAEAKAWIGVENPHRADVLTELRRSTVARVCTGRAGPRPRTQALLRFLADHSRSKDTVLKEVPEEWVKAQGLLEVRSEISDKNLYLTRPDMGRRLCAEAVEALKAQCVANPDVQVVISDGLSTDAITVNYEEILPPLMAGLKQAGLKVGTPFFVRYGRVKIEDQIGEILGAKVGKRRCGRRWWNIPMNSDNRVGTAPISISALSKRWSPRRPARRGYLRASLYAVFPRYRLFISRRYRRWVNILKSISCLPTPAVITGAILKILLIWRNC